VALDGVDCSVGSNPLLENNSGQSGAVQSSASTESPVAVTVSITQHVNGLLTAAIAPSPVTLYVRPTSANVISFLQACIKPVQQNLDSVHNYRRELALQRRPQILAALSTPDDVKIGCDVCVVFAPGLADGNVGADVRARVDVDVSVCVGDVRFDVKARQVAASAAVDMAAAAAGLTPHSITHHIASIQSFRLRGSMSGAAHFTHLLFPCHAASCSKESCFIVYVCQSYSDCLQV
jgi:hypothetical protein